MMRWFRIRVMLVPTGHALLPWFVRVELTIKK